MKRSNEEPKTPLDSETEVLVRETMLRLSENMEAGLTNVLGSIDPIKLETLGKDLSVVSEIIGYFRAKEDCLREDQQYQDLMMRAELYKVVLVQEFRRKDEVVMRSGLTHVLDSNNPIKFGTLGEDISIVSEIMGDLRAKENDLRGNKQDQYFMIEAELCRDVLMREFRRKDELVMNLLHNAYELRSTWVSTT